ncbi:MAG: adenosine deaminase [bacterium]|nr:adenosine deaminase [bacterium]
MNTPKVLLHDHLDGGLRPRTVLELAFEAGHEGLPASSEEIESLFESRAAGSLEEYLVPFEHTVAVMQTPEAIRRVAKEAVLDHAADSVVYGELRLAPSLHLERGLTRGQVIQAALEGLELGQEQTGMTSRLIVCAMRDQGDSTDVACAAAPFAEHGVVGFDLAGPEAGFLAKAHSAAIDIARASGLHITIHAGEGDGVASIEDALASGAERIGHGVRITEDLDAGNGVLRFGPTADRVRYERIALEICPKSEVDTRAVLSLAAHPIDILFREGFVTTINTDNTLMSKTDMSREFELLSHAKGFTNSEFRAMTLNAIDVAFCDPVTKNEVRSRVEAGYAGLAGP